MAYKSKSPFVLVFVLLLFIALASYLTYRSYEGYRKIDCQGVTCPEGEFCLQNTCRSITA